MKIFAAVLLAGIVIFLGFIIYVELHHTRMLLEWQKSREIALQEYFNCADTTYMVLDQVIEVDRGFLEPKPYRFEDTVLIITAYHCKKEE